MEQQVTEIRFLRVVEQLVLRINELEKPRKYVCPRCQGKWEDQVWRDTEKWISVDKGPLRTKELSTECSMCYGDGYIELKPYEE